MKLSRRDFIKHAAMLTAMASFPRLSFASVPSDQRFIFIILRGGLDGLAAVPPYGDHDYQEARGSLAFAAPGQNEGAIDLDGFFGLNPALELLLPLYQQKQLAILHATASPYRERSHFDAQNMLENGTTHTGGNDGWLNRALQALDADSGSAIAFNQQVPLVLQGQVNVESWSPKNRDVDPGSDYMVKVARMYQQDPLLAASFEEGLKAQTFAESTLSDDDKQAGRTAKGADQLYTAAKAAGSFLTKENGPRIAVMEASGWDTHARQGTANGPLYNHLAELGKGLAALPDALGSAWNQTIVAVVTEFGRTVAENGTGGTDHGTGGFAFVMGGAINGGQVISQWPGLSSGNLYQGRDLMPTMDTRSLFKTILYAHYQLPWETIEKDIFPDSAYAGYMDKLLA